MAEKRNPKTSSPSRTISVIIETPRGSRNKYKYEETSARMKLSKVMPEGMMFPYDFGFVPGTTGDDGDPLDVLVLSDAPTFPACEVECCLIGVIKALHSKEGKQIRNDRIIAVAEASVLYGNVKEIAELGDNLLRQIEEFFVNYQKVRDIRYRIIGREGANAAWDLVEAGTKRREAA